jgi:hypothetical protein
LLSFGRELNVARRTSSRISFCVSRPENLFERVVNCRRTSHLVPMRMFFSHARQKKPHTGPDKAKLKIIIKTLFESRGLKYSRGQINLVAFLIPTFGTNLLRRRGDGPIKSGSCLHREQSLHIIALSESSQDGATPDNARRQKLQNDGAQNGTGNSPKWTRPMRNGCTK